MKLKDNYYNKNDFIKDVLKMARYMKKEHKERNAKHTLFYNKFVGIEWEYWKFTLYVNSEKVSTEAILFQDGKETKFPFTTWGDKYKRWDSDLKEFLMREINKQ